MEELTKIRVKEVSDKIQAFLNKLSEEEGIKMTMCGGKYTSDGFNLKIKGELLTDDGEAFVSDTSNRLADEMAKREGVSYSTPHFIGSVWRDRGELIRVVKYERKNRNYPVICKYYEENRRCKAQMYAFTRSVEVKMPTVKEFKVWFETDVEDDAISRKDEEIFDNVNDFISCYFEDNKDLDKFFYLADTCLEKKLFSATEDIYHILFTKGVTDTINYIKKLIK